MITIDEFKKKYATRSRLIGIDLGSKRIGIGISDEYRKIATPYKTINKTTIDDLIKQLKEIISENNIKGIIIGNPINMDGSSGPSAQSAKDFAKYLSNNISVPVSMWDERLSTSGAFNLSSNLDISVSKKVEKLDQNAASFILQGAIDYIKR